MKTNIKIYFAAGLLALTAAGCTDLDVDVNSMYTEYPSSDIALEAKMADVYYAFRGALGRRYNEAQTLSSDEAVGISFDGDYKDDRNYAHMSLHDYTPDDAAIGYYGELASGITKCNQIIVELGGDEAAPSAIAPARAMRAFYHFILMDSYGDVPILNFVPEDSDQIVRAPRADVARFIESELLDVIPQLSTKVDASTYGKPTRWMAEALLVKLYINWPVYTASDVTAYDAATATNEKLADCVTYCDDIIASGLFNLGEGYTWRQKFFPDNGVQIKDFIYAMPYDCITQTGMTYARFRNWRKSDGGTYDGQDNYTYFGEPKSKSFGGNIALTPEFSSLFSLEGDQRNDAILNDTIYEFDPATRNLKSPKTPWLYKGSPVVLTKTITLKVEDPDLNVGADVNGWSQGYRSNKFYLQNSDYMNGRNQSNDVPIFRYADILLTKAEAILRGATATNGDTPVSLMNQVRAYAGAPTVSSVSLTDLYQERGREFFDENWRRNDMIRFGTFESEFGFHKQGFPTANFSKTRRIFPLPTAILNENTNWSQNEGY